MSYVDLGYDRSIMVTLTPDEIRNMLIDFGERYHKARENGSESTIEDLAAAYYNLSLNMLQDVDPTRFLCNS